MNKLFGISAVLLCCLQVASAATGTLPGERPVKTRKVEVAFNKTVHILFPAAVKYVDLGSTDLLAGKADGAENVIRVKAAVRGFQGETNFSVITADGIFYSFTATYSDSPSELTVEMEDWLHKDPYGNFASQQAYVQLPELGEQTPLIVNRVMYTIYKQNARPIKTIGSKRFGVQLLLKGLFVHEDLFYFHISLRNTSKVDYDIDRIRFRIADRKVAKRTAVQETVLEPVRTFNQTMQVKAGETLRNVYAFPKFTIPDDKVLIMDIFERNGGRHQSFMVQETDLAGAQEVNELKLR